MHPQLKNLRERYEAAKMDAAAAEHDLRTFVRPVIEALGDRRMGGGETITGVWTDTVGGLHIDTEWAGGEETDRYTIPANVVNADNLLEAAKAHMNEQDKQRLAKRRMRLENTIVNAQEELKRLGAL